MEAALSYSGVTLERVPWVPVNPSIFHIPYKNATEMEKLSTNPLKKRALIDCEPMDLNS